MLSLNGWWRVLRKTASLITKFPLCWGVELKMEGYESEKAQIFVRFSCATEQPDREGWGSSSWDLQTISFDLPANPDWMRTRAAHPSCIYTAVSVSQSHKAWEREGWCSGGRRERWRGNDKKKRQIKWQQVREKAAKRDLHGVPQALKAGELFLTSDIISISFLGGLPCFPLSVILISFDFSPCTLTQPLAIQCDPHFDSEMKATEALWNSQPLPCAQWTLS